MSTTQNDYKIALVDDHDLFRAGIKTILKANTQFKVILEATNGETFFEKLSSHNELPDVILLDIRMPKMDGFETAKKVFEDYPSIKIIVLSMHDETRHIVKMIELGANGYLFKNAHPNEVIESIHMVIENDYYFNRQINSIMRKIIRYKGSIPDESGVPVDLSEREIEVLNLICKEFTSKEIAEKLFLSFRTIEGHRNNLIAKTGVRNMAGLVVYAMKHELVKL